MTFVPPRNISITRSFFEGAEPSLVFRMINVLSLWTQMEVALSQAFGMILDVEAETAMTMYTAITNDGSRKSAFMAVANKKLDKEKNAGLLKIFEEIKGRAKVRNKIAHGVWGLSPERPNAVFYTDPNTYILWQSSLHTAIKSDDVDEAQHLMKRWPNAEGFEAKDFDTAEDEIIELIGMIENFKHSLAS